jgi:hypothetical protein
MGHVTRLQGQWLCLWVPGDKVAPLPVCYAHESQTASLGAGPDYEKSSELS